MTTTREGIDRAPGGPVSDATRRRVAVETYARHEATLRRTARRYSLCVDDAEDALQRGLEILLRKAPSEDPRELIRWTQTVVKHEALAVRRDRERILSGPAASAAEAGSEDWVAMIPSPADGPAERAERREVVARSREALRSLKPQELRALTLLAEGYSYAEIAEMTGFSKTKINRCLAEGRARFRSALLHSESGDRCDELTPLLSRLCDGEADEREASEIRDHLRVCGHCRATLRAYRAAPPAAAALAPTLALHRTLLERLHDGVATVAARFGAGGGDPDSTLGQWAAAGGSRGAGMAALAKVLAVCAGTVGGAAACVATGVVPTPLEIGLGHEPPAAIERHHDPASTEVPDSAAEPDLEPAPASVESPAALAPEAQPSEDPAADPPAAEAGAVEFAPSPPPAPPTTTPLSAATGSSGSAAGEFGP